MSYFRDAAEVEAVFGRFLEDYLASPEGAQASKASRALDVPARLECRILDPEATLTIDMADGRVEHGSLGEASVRIELEASALHDILLERLDPVQISRLFEEDRAALVGRPEALQGFLAFAASLGDCYRQSLADQGRADLLDTPEPAGGLIWQSDGPPKHLIGSRRPWQQEKRMAEPV